VNNTTTLFKTIPFVPYQILLLHFVESHFQHDQANQQGAGDISMALEFRPQDVFEAPRVLLWIELVILSHV